MTFRITIAAVAATLTGLTAAYAVDVPILDVHRTCHPIAAEDGTLDPERCLKTERGARDQLVREWADFPAADKTLCTQMGRMGGLPSYVQLITCLEMKREVAKLPPDRGDRQALGPADQVTKDRRRLRRGRAARRKPASSTAPCSRR